MLKPKCILFLAVILCSSSILCNAYNDGAIAQLVNLCSNIEVRALSHNNLNDYPGYGSKGKRTPMWFGPRMGKRSELNLDSMDDQPGPVTVDDMFSNVHGLVKRELDDKLGPDSQWVVYLVNGKWEPH